METFKVFQWEREVEVERERERERGEREVEVEVERSLWAGVTPSEALIPAARRGLCPQQLLASELLLAWLFVLLKGNVMHSYLTV